MAVADSATLSANSASSLGLCAAVPIDIVPRGVSKGTSQKPDGGSRKNRRLARVNARIATLP
ncbi:hypothetical protein EN788_66865 [Mesorhizobium sp. M2D.F.Ca.ET.145.01.1.1]|nr:hypothetical protein EN788_66865 [Mesorhizobium sp. M2D.F.Ca.ET.145.01.1.1]